MPFIPHTETDIQEMLETIGAPDINTLFDEIPDELRIKSLKVPTGMNEMEVTRLMHDRAKLDGEVLNFIGAGAYEHHIPAAVWQITTRGEFYSAYTPYQAEASQGTLQLIYEYQTMMTALTGMDISNASMYDGASALAEACLMSVRAQRRNKSKRILLPQTVHPFYREVVKNIAGTQDLEFVDIPFDPQSGKIDLDAVKAEIEKGIVSLVIPQPNFFGVLEPVDELVDMAHAANALAIAVVNPISLALLKAPGEWGNAEENRGADIVCGEGQPLGVPVSSGGPYFGFMCCKQAHVRQMPGRIVGRTVDLDGKQGFALTLQAREQHIRRSKATSNICTNQGLMVTAATIYMSLLGSEGLERVAASSYNNTQKLVKKLTAIDGVEPVFSGEFFHEAVVQLPRGATKVLEDLSHQDIAGGVALGDFYPELKDCIVVCATETKTEEDLDVFALELKTILSH
ncbi:MAG: aminomethyl-transferring glycine dehydrogenase subunit GcvPA [Gammaproteobacteria bacterium]|nr:aminomethyl-transferring glycine dehydrogenase subunit GcvPA [Gammaproteobacteria bacterium]NNC97133.1 aminomethyl-transferring glycine dehydrogenase subunit GcvPA [Gammaproteobacteria bacterium]NNM13621.1 aminomethyl-transferring glycine dehydrogenase subunit GcvPA [Gammaproteobacteria bacterium]